MLTAMESSSSSTSASLPELPSTSSYHNKDKDAPLTSTTLDATSHASSSKSAYTLAHTQSSSDNLVLVTQSSSFSPSLSRNNTDDYNHNKLSNGGDNTTIMQESPSPSVSSDSKVVHGKKAPSSSTLSWPSISVSNRAPNMSFSFSPSISFTPSSSTATSSSHSTPTAPASESDLPSSDAIVKSPTLLAGASGLVSLILPGIPEEKDDDDDDNYDDESEMEMQGADMYIATTARDFIQHQQELTSLTTTKLASSQPLTATSSFHSHPSTPPMSSTSATTSLAPTVASTPIPTQLSLSASEHQHHQQQQIPFPEAVGEGAALLDSIRSSSEPENASTTVTTATSETPQKAAKRKYKKRNLGVNANNNNNNNNNSDSNTPSDGAAAAGGSGGLGDAEEESGGAGGTTTPGGGGKEKGDKENQTRAFACTICGRGECSFW
jgi:hypothetical protein